VGDVSFVSIVNCVAVLLYHMHVIIFVIYYSEALSVHASLHLVPISPYSRIYLRVYSQVHYTCIYIYIYI
jgi:hypothetical protein